MSTLLLETSARMGGQAAKTNELENYPGIDQATGPDLMGAFRNHAERFGVNFERGTVSDIQLESNGFIKTITMADGKSFRARTVIVATGAQPRILGIKGEREFTSKGVSYCATCDADFFEELDIVVVGSGNTAVEESVFLTKFVNSITMIVLHDEGILDADRTAQEQAFANDKINFVWNSTVEEICGEDLVSGVRVKNLKTGETSDIACEGVFMFVGTVPNTEFLQGTVELSKGGYIKVDDQMATNVPGVFGAGDVNEKFLRQVVTAAADGAIAAVAAERYMQEEENWQERVLEADSEVAVMFWNPLDQTGIALMPEVDKFCSEQELPLVTIDTYKSQNIAARYNIEQVPTIVRFSHGQEVKRVVAPAAEQLNQLL